MFKKLSSIFKYIQLKSINDSKKNNKKSIKIPTSLEETKTKLKGIFSDCGEFVMKEVILGNELKVKIIVAFIDGLTNEESVDSNILKPIMIESRKVFLDNENKDLLSIIKKHILNSCIVDEERDFNTSVNMILDGNTVLFIDGEDTSLVIEAKAWEARGIEKSEVENVVRGPREAFTEQISVNVSQIRRRIKNPDLKTEYMKIGEKTNTDICICYIKGVVNKDILKTVKRRLERIKTDSILESGYLEEFIEDGPFSLFATLGNSEKPDIIAAKLLEGRVAILTDGTPVCLTAPYLFIESLHVSEDYYSRYFFSSVSRIFRVLGLLISAYAPAIYVALITFHRDIIPFELLLTMAGAKEGVPFSPLVEALIMLIAFELLKEAGVRMPRPVGQAVSIVGALVLGEAAIQAGVASPPMVITIAATAIASFTVQPLQGTIPIFRFFMLFAANILGFLGIMLVTVVILIHMCSLRSFGVPYLYPFSPLTGSDLKDTILRAPIWAMFTRPKALSWDGNKNTKYKMNIDYRKKED
ncbi:MAG: spore germination protein [Firmicutes bacterium]|nr:spore germination protein [Bacillota bacterium]